MYQVMARFQMWKWDRTERGATAVEYGLMVAAIAAVIITIVIAVGAKVNDGFKTVNDNMGGIGN
jgi:pilus assembly protein Flp/PilA